MTNQYSEPIQTYARIAGAVFLIAFVAGGFGEALAPAQIVVSGSAAATAQNVVDHGLFYRVGFLAYLGEAVTDVTLTFLLYVILRPVHRNLAFLAVLFRLMATATFSFAELFYYVPSLLLGGDSYLKTFSTAQLDSLSLLAFNVYSAGGNLFTVHYGIASMILGYLVLRSRFLPRALGGLWALAGLGFVVANVVYLFAPAAAMYFLLPQIVTIVVLGLWLLIRGVDEASWTRRATMQPAP